MEKELRSIETQFNLDDNKRTVSGYAIVFDSYSEDLGFREIINKSAVTEELINNSDVFAKLNHCDDKILARSNRGKGSLKLTIDERGLRYEFEAPYTQYGEELLEHLRRGEINRSSFAFTVDKNDKEAERWTRSAKGTLKREIYKISGLYDVSPVFTPAYNSTSCDLRAINEELDKALEEDKLAKEIDDKLTEIIEEVKPVENNTQVIEETPVENLENLDNSEESINIEEVKAEDIKEESENKEENNSTEIVENDTEKEDEAAAEDVETSNDVSDEKRDNNKYLRKKMEKRFSLINALNAMSNKKGFDEISEAVNMAGQEEMRKANVVTNGGFVIPSKEYRDGEITVAAEGEDVVATDLFDVIEPLRANSVLAQAGAKFVTGLTNNVQYPVLSAGNVGWEDEIAEASAFGSTFGKVELKPKRLSAFVDISKKMLVQDSVGVENAIRRDIINAIAEKLQATILGTEAGSDVKPAGLFAGSPATVSDYKGLLDLEASVEDANVYGKGCYIVSNKAKAGLRNMAKSAKTSALVMENGAIDGTPVYNTSAVAGQGIAYGDFSNLIIGQWGGIELSMVEDATLAAKGLVRIVVNAFFDAQVLREGAIAVATL